MKISEAIKRLQAIQEKHGDLPIVGGYMSDDVPLRQITPIDKNGIDVWGAVKAAGVFLS